MHNLLIPRFKVIADYPANINDIGTIIILDQVVNKSAGAYVDGQMYSEDVFKQWPHLFKPLGWWEERKIEEMPEYVKYSDSVLKDMKDGIYWVKEKGVLDKKNGFYCKLYGIDSKIRFNYSRFTPAAEAEYNEFINRK